MYFRTTLLTLMCMVLTDIFCYAQKTGGDFLRMQDSLYALHQLPGHSTFNAKPFFSSGNIVKGSTGRNKFTGILTRPDNTICFDTSRRSFLFNDTAIFYTRNPYPSADGNFFLSGDYVRTTSPYNSGGFLAKLDHKGTILWHRTYTRTDGPGNAYVNFYRVIELHDGSVFLAGSTYDRVTGNNDIMLAKTDFQGNLTWSKIYNSRLWGTGSGSTDYYYVQQMKEDPATNEIYLAGPTWSDGRTMMKVSSMNGNIAWSKAYEAGGHFDNPFGFDIKPGELRLFSKSVDNYAVISMTRINKLTGDTIACRYWKSEDTAGIKVDFLGTNPLTILDNGNYVLTGSSYGNYIYLWNGITAFYQASVVEFDNNFNFIKAYNFRNAIESNSYNTKISTYPDGNSFFTMLHIYSGYTADVYSVQLMNGQIVKQRVKLTQVGIPYEPIAVKAPDGGDLIMRLIGDTSDGINKIELLNMHASDTSSVCFGISDNSTYLYPFNVIPTHYYTSQVQSDIFQETTNYSVSTAILADHYLPGCAQVSHCDSIKLLPSAVVLCPSQALQITGRKNIGCGSNIAWRFNSTGIASSSQPNDSTLLLQFSGPWTGYVYGSILGCSVITDSVFITVIQAPVSLNLGDDFNICPGNTRLLNAQAGYASYLWQDGSTASTFLVMSPGTYNVTATDACGVIFHDTIHVFPHAPVLVSVGPDRIKCNTDTLILHAPAGFISYQWSPGYNITGINSQVAVINPSVDTSYIIKVEAEPGCFGFDTIKVNVFHSPAITLGNDTSFCNGQSVTLSAGMGFTGYTWNTGSLADHISVNLPGIYSVTGTTSNGCKSYDTLKILEVYNNPTVVLDHNERLCQGTWKILNAGNYSSYLWQNGAATQTLAVNDIGTYYVDVTDNHGCKGTDTARISMLLSLPTGFLPVDSTKCNYEKIILQPSRIYTNYLWNTNSTAATIAVTQPGLYWLEVKDQQGCIGRDSTLIKQKECLKGLFVPTAFSPNADGTNDWLKAFLFGDVEKFEFSIYNRFGQLMFFTSNLNEGWDGIYKGVKQEQNAFVWKCHYKMAREVEKIENGTFILLR